jgi:phosphoglycerate dehydrogenase-like enzyme
MKPVIITEKEFFKAESVFRSAHEFEFISTPPDENLISSAIREYHAVAAVLGVEQYDHDLYSALPHGGIIARFGVGHDGIDKQKSTQAGLFVTNTPGVLDDSVAEHAIWLMGALARNICRHNIEMQRSKWQPSLGIELAGKTLLVIGCGKIGSKVAKIASFGFGMYAIGYDVAQLDHEKMKYCGFSEIASSLENVLPKADFISLHLPSLPQTRHFIDAAFLSKMKPLTYLVNTARGPVVDEIVLYDILKAGKIAGAGLDVFENEPYVPVTSDKDLRTLPNVVLTPHVGSSTTEACQRMAKRVLFNLHACLEKRYNDMDIVNPDVLKELANEPGKRKTYQR